MFYKVMMWVVAFGVVAATIDKLMNNRFGIGDKMDIGFDSMGPLAFAIAGIVVLAPVLAGWLKPVLTPVLGVFGIDPAMIACLIANDMGGYPMAMSLAESEEMGLMSGCITAAMLGCTLVFSLPVGLGLIEEEDKPYFCQGLLYGLFTIPVGSIVGGLAAGFDPMAVIINNIPIAIFSAILAIGFAFKPDVVNKCVNAFCKFISWIALIGIPIGAFAHLTGVPVPFFENADTMLNAFEIVSYVVIVMIGIMPVFEIMLRVLKKPFGLLGKALKINEVAAAGMLITTANSIPVYKTFKDMDKRGKVINIAWVVPATAALGDHVGFTAGVEPTMIAPMVIGKLTAGVIAVIIAMIGTKKLVKAKEK